MSWKIIGIEGAVPDSATVVWGAAALSDDARLVNSYTQTTTSVTAIDQLRSDRHLHVFPTPIEIPDEDANQELVVVMVQKGTAHEALFRPETGRLGGVVVTTTRRNWRYYVFAGQQAFSIYANVAASAVLKDVLYKPQVGTPENRAAVLMALTLAPEHVQLNALRAYLDGRPAAERLARAAVRGDQAREEFDIFLRALKDETAEYQLKYEHGAAAGGGFDVDVAKETLGAMQEAQRGYVPYFEHHFPFLNVPPPARLWELRAASAEFHFVAAVKGKSVGERVARYLSLRFIEEALRGDRNQELASSRELRAAIQKLAQPAPATTLKQKRLSETEREEVHRQDVPLVEPVWTRPLRVLGFISGLRQDSRAEIAIGTARRFFVSTLDNGAREVPKGAEAIKGDGRFLRRPCVFTIIRESSQVTPERFHLQEMHVLQPGDTKRIDSFPSGVLPGAFVTGLGIRVEYELDGLLLTRLGPLGRTKANLASANRWLATYREHCAEFELEQNAETLTWVRPSRIEPPSSLLRVLIVLNGFRQPLPVTDVVAGINERFSTVVRSNNTQREVLLHPEYFQWAEGAERALGLSDRGRRFVRAYIAAGGATEAP